MTKKILITGFFGTRTAPEPEAMNNPSGIIAGRLDGRRIHDHEVHGVVINSSLSNRASQIKTLIDDIKPDVYLALGVDSKSDRFLFQEEIQNIFHTTNYDDHLDGILENYPIVTGGPAILRNDHIDLLNLQKHFQDAGLEAGIRTSTTGAGSLVAAYAQLYYSPKATRALFMHLPPDPGFASWIASTTGHHPPKVLPLVTLEQAALLAIDLLVPKPEN